MHKFVRSLITEWRKLGLLFSDGTVIVAVSGGADSMALLLSIHDLVERKKLGLRVIVAHFNHKLRGRESDADERFVRERSAALNFEFVSDSGAPARKQNLEENARKARYKFLMEKAHSTGAFAVLTAHTQNDQAETFLLNLIRGSGPDGLGSMKPVREMSDRVLLVRPLLSWAKREDTELFCREQGVDYRTDRMNDDQTFTRVRIRKTLLPMLAEFNPKIVETLARTAELLRQQSDDERPANGSSPDVKTESRASVAGDPLELRDLRSLTKGALYSTIRSWLRSTRGNVRSLELKHIASIERLVFSPGSGKFVELPGGGRVVKHRGRLTFSNIKVEK